MGMNTMVVSWVPNYCIHGMVVRHGEAFSISDRLTVWEGERGDLPADRPLCVQPVRRGHCLAP